jgi:hypothetical protein
VRVVPSHNRGRFAESVGDFLLVRTHREQLHGERVMEPVGAGVCDAGAAEDRPSVRVRSCSQARSVPRPDQKKCFASLSAAHGSGNTRSTAAISG